MSNNTTVSKIPASPFSRRRAERRGQGASNSGGSGRRRTEFRGFSCRSGIAAIEFAFLAPVFLLMVAGLCQFGMVLGDYVTLEHAAAAGIRALAISRGDGTPVSDTQTQVFASAVSLKQSNIALNYNVNGTSCSTDATCSPSMLPGVPAYIVATYPCNLVVMGTNFLPGCTLSVTSAERVE